MKKTTILCGAVASVVTALVGQAQAAPPDYWLNVPVDNVYGNSANWLDGIVTGDFLNDSTVTNITVGVNQGVNSGTVGTTLNGPFSIAAPTSSYTFSGGPFLTASGSSFSVLATATAATQTINSSFYIAARAGTASNQFSAGAPVATSKFIINGNFNYQTTVASGVTTAGISMPVNLSGAGYGVFNGIIADGNTATGGVAGATTAGNVYVQRTTSNSVWELNGANSYSGGTEMLNNSGQVTILGNKTALGTGPLRLSGGNTGFTIRSNTDLSGPNAVANTFNFVGGYGANTTTNAVLAFTAGSNTATLTSGVTPAVGDVITGGNAASYLPLYTRVTAVSGSTITLSNNAVNFTGTPVFSASTTAPISATGNGFTNLTINGTNNLEFSGTMNLSTTYSNLAAVTQSFLVSNTGTTTFSGVLQQQGGVATLNKQLAGTLILSGANTYTGGTTVNNGGGQLLLGSGVATYGSLTAVAGGPAPVTVGGSAFVGARTSDNVTIPNAISGAGKLLQAGTGTTTVTASNTFSGGTTISAGTLNIAGINSLGGSNYGANGGTGLTFSGTGGTLQYATTPTSSTDISADASGVAKIVTFTANAAIDTNGNNVTYSNTIGNGGVGGLSKVGAGTLTVTASNYTGTTVVKRGTLDLKAGAQTPVLTGANGADIQGGALQLDYTGGTSPVAAIKTLLTSEYATNGGNFTTGQIRSTTAAAAGKTIGYGDNGTDTVTIAYTLAGDANLNGTVDFNDFLVLQNNFNASGTRFDQGNFNYDGLTDFNDFLVLQNNFGQSITGEPVTATKAQVATITAFGLANAVPEPTTLAVIGLGGVLLGRRRRA